MALPGCSSDMRRLLFLLLLAGCKQADPCATGVGACIDLTVTSSARLSIDTIRVTATGAVDGMHAVPAGKSVALPTDVPVGLPDTAGGAITLFVEGILAGNVVGNGSIDLNVNIGQRPHLTVDIEPQVETPPDLLPVNHDMGITLDQACGDVARARCMRLATCSTSAPTYISRTWGDEQTCEQRIKLDCVTEANAAGTGITVSSLEACAPAFTAQTCIDRFAGYRPTSCDVKGTRAKASSCYYDTQCLSGFCHIDSAQACGVCADPSVAGATSCTDGDDCSGHLICAMNVCQIPGVLNGSCSMTKPCGEELDCVSGICKQNGASVGIACDANAATQPSCDHDLGLYCSSANTCAVAQTATLANPSCGVVGGVRVFCTNGADCFAGTCKPPSAEGASCDTTNGPSCRFPSHCISGTCQLPNPSKCN